MLKQTSHGDQANICFFDC
ncbi:MAG: hypothetical protein DRQ51_00820 [Gammaproteobacteria bacterium]|nr:MAG: hypothetical protein DRQ51_00820 [Gammaproteobacteria bacterium]